MRIEWKARLMSSEIFKAHVRIFSRKAFELHPKTLFVDARQHKYTVPADVQKWHDETIIPIYTKSGVKKMAFLNPESIFTELTTKKVFSSTNAKQLLPTQFFKYESEALYWLDKIESDSSY